MTEMGARGANRDVTVDVRDPEQMARSSSAGELLQEVAADLSRLMRQELELAKAELRDEAQQAARGVGMLAGAGMAALVMVLFASTALMWLLGSWLPLGWSALIVAALWAIVGGVLYGTGRARLRAVRPPEQTIQTLKEDVEWARTRNA
jgi:hypothetical protein